jgi:Flp pilus assembly protein TadG
MKLSRMHRDESAQGLVEFALLSTALLLIFLGTIDFSRYLYYQTSLTSAARVGAEMASNGCLSRNTCGTELPPSINSAVIQAVYCEAAPHVPLRPSVSCTTCLTAVCANDDPCSATPCVNCTQDICITRSPSGPPAHGQTVTVKAAYNFTFISPVVGQFFANRPDCLIGSTTHNICAQSVGLVF